MPRRTNGGPQRKRLGFVEDRAERNLRGVIRLQRRTGAIEDVVERNGEVLSRLELESATNSMRTEKVWKFNGMLMEKEEVTKEEREARGVPAFDADSYNAVLQQAQAAEEERKAREANPREGDAGPGPATTAWRGEFARVARRSPTPDEYYEQGQIQVTARRAPLLRPGEREEEMDEIDAEGEPMDIDGGGAEGNAGSSGMSAKAQGKQRAK